MQETDTTVKVCIQEDQCQELPLIETLSLLCRTTLVSDLSALLTIIACTTEITMRNIVQCLTPDQLLKILLEKNQTADHQVVGMLGTNVTSSETLNIF